MDPLRSEHFKWSSLVWIIFGKKSNSLGGIIRTKLVRVETRDVLVRQSVFIVDRVSFEWLISMYLFSFCFIFFPPSRQLLTPSCERICDPWKFWKITTIICKLNVSSSFHYRIQVVFNFWILKCRNVTCHQRVRQISQRHKIANSKALMNSLLLFICEVVEHTCHVWHLIVTGYFWLVVLRITCIVIRLVWR